MTEAFARDGRAVVGLIPAAGLAKRIAPLPMSKELYPIGFRIRNGTPQPKVVCQYLLDKFARAKISEAYIVLRKGKWDIPDYFGDGAFTEIHLSYLIMREPYGPPFSLDQAYPFVRTKLVAFGFPDIIFTREDVFTELLECQNASKSDIVLGLFPAHDCRIMDMVDVDEKGNIRAMFLKPAQSDLRYAWVCAVWTPNFARFMHEYLSVWLKENRSKADSKEVELTVGAVIQASLKEGLKVNGVAYPSDRYIDIGTPPDLVTAVEVFGRNYLANNCLSLG